MLKGLTLLIACFGLVLGVGLATLLPGHWREHIERSTAIEDSEYIKLTHQFVVPIVQDGDVHAMMMLSLGLEITVGMREVIFSKEPKLRDSLLSVMFSHANTGGFDGVFTDGVQLGALRRALLEAAQSVVGLGIRDVLISDIVRQEA